MGLNPIGPCDVCLAMGLPMQVPNVTDAAFEEMYRRELRVMVALGTSMTGSRDAGAELAHEAMLRAYRSWSQVGQLDRPGAWVRRVLINLAVDWHRRNGRERRALRRVGQPRPVELADPVSTDFWSAVRALPERQRAAVTLHYLEDMSIREIADVLEVTDGTVKASLFTARRSLASTMRTEEVVS